MKRINMNISSELVDWFDKKSSEIGVSRTALMSMAMYQYMEQRENIKALGNVQLILDKLEKMDNNKR